MALTFDYSEVADWDNLDKVTKEQIIWATIDVGINHITEKNADDFFARVSLSEKVCAPYRRQLVDDEWQDMPFTREEIHSLIGLKTNASVKPISTFKTHIWNMHQSFNKG